MIWSGRKSPPWTRRAAVPGSPVESPKTRSNAGKIPNYGVHEGEAGQGHFRKHGRTGGQLVYPSPARRREHHASARARRNRWAGPGQGAKTVRLRSGHGLGCRFRSSSIAPLRPSLSLVTRRRRAVRSLPGFTSALRIAYEVVAPGDPHIGVHDAVVRAGLVSQVTRTRLGRLRFKLAREASRLLTGAGRGLGRRAA